MAHNIVRFASTVFNRPHLITPEAFEPIARYIDARLVSPDLTVIRTDRPVEKKPGYEMIGRVASIPIQGSLTYKPVQDMCGEVGTSYQEIVAATESALNSGAKVVVFEVASGGGEAAVLFDTADTIHDMIKEAGAKSIAYIETHAGSAAYGLSVVADEVIAHPSASAGSIGAVIGLLNDSKRMKNLGLQRVFITSTPGKVPFEADGSFSESFLAKLQAEVTKLGLQFAEHVSKYSGIPVEDILAMDAQMFNAEDALERGLVNKIMTHREFAAYVASLDK